MAERRVGLIPHATTIMRAAQAEECAVLVTDRRTIIAFEQARVKGFRASMKRDFESPEEEVARLKQQIDFGVIDLDMLAGMNENISVPHTAIDRLRLKKGFSGYSLTIDYHGEDGKKLVAFAEIAPHADLMKLRKKEGKTKEQVRLEYAEKAQEVFKRALPPVAQGKAEWLS